jgi:alkanesulfonate monooxygenase SsuD/methylene tetrahydromethanopterin reductase-like flavin-dependent oxidoreductase (luciferase family)
VLAYGTPDRIAARVREFLDAGADHVRLGTTAPDFETAVSDLERLGPSVGRRP